MVLYFFLDEIHNYIGAEGVWLSFMCYKLWVWLLVYIYNWCDVEQEEDLVDEEDKDDGKRLLVVTAT